MKKYFSQFTSLLVGAFLLISMSVNSQVVLQSQTFSDFLSLQNQGTIKRAILTEDDIQGSPYLNKEFVLGKIITRDNIEYLNVPLRYNIYNDDIEFEMSKDVYLAIANPKKMREIWIGDEVYVYTIKRNKKGDQEGYYQLLFDGDTRLLSRYNIVLRPPTETTGYKQAESAKLERNSNTFYFQTGDGEPLQISKKKDLAIIFGSQVKKVESFVKKQKINIRKEEGLVKLAEFVNESL